MTWLVTGGAGYIGSLTIVELLERGDDVVALDNLMNSSAESLRRATQITRREVPFVEADVRDGNALDAIFGDYDIQGVIHFAGLKAVGESVEKPLEYYRDNIDSAICLIDAMTRHRVKKLVFSSTATVYGTDADVPYKETHPVGVGITNPYAWSKFMIEQIMRDVVAADPEWQATILRYFNPIGAHESGLMGEDPQGYPNNLLPFLAQVAVGRRAKLLVYGDDYDTPDGTGVRDYLHVKDLALGHIAALDHFGEPGQTKVYNLGSGHGTSVLEVIKAFEAASGEPIPYEVVGRRAGDIGAFWADASLAERELGWTAKKSVYDACLDIWKWQSQNPHGYASEPV